MKAVSSRWLSSLRGSFGVILGQDEKMGYYCAYLGIARGISTAVDEEEIMSWGAPLSLLEAKGFFPDWDINNYKNI